METRTVEQCVISMKKIDKKQDHFVKTKSLIHNIYT